MNEKAMRWARVFAVLVIVGVGAAAFRLSFSTLRDLAKLAHVPSSDAWLLPLIIDGTIVQATAAVLVLAKSTERRWFTGVLVVGAIVSVAGNSLHAIANGHELPGWACAVVAAIAPVGLLVDTHGLALLLRTPVRAREPVTEPASEPVNEIVPEPIPAAEPITVPEPVPAAVPEVIAAPVAAAPVRRRPAAVVQPMLPLAVPVTGA
ncbi:DUF2637 domain-containing protein [Nocardia sp. alder85J]|uniref:DUF2637 domain-containing protein n=1 Tax=Nocardia sp. alder85J TaxID=2862949 RepID=UPI001CD55A84|nr:DUF2637 domain-containing protein [Nocardia sp. alder85J]MCX4093665.1 DUF2637 domain-containing protein [Nocardia sp. alder85J]